MPITDSLAGHVSSRIRLGIRIPAESQTHTYGPTLGGKFSSERYQLILMMVFLVIIWIPTACKRLAPEDDRPVKSGQLSPPPKLPADSEKIADGGKIEIRDAVYLALPKNIQSRSEEIFTALQHLVNGSNSDLELTRNRNNSNKVVVEISGKSKDRDMGNGETFRAHEVTIVFELDDGTRKSIPLDREAYKEAPDLGVLASFLTKLTIRPKVLASDGQRSWRSLVNEAFGGNGVPDFSELELRFKGKSFVLPEMQTKQLLIYLMGRANIDVKESTDFEIRCHGFACFMTGEAENNADFFKKNGKQKMSNSKISLRVP